MGVIKDIITHTATNLFNSLFPPVCYACNIRIDEQKKCLCVDCMRRLRPHTGLLIGEFTDLDMDFYHAICLYQYDYMVHNLIHDFKYKNIKNIGNLFAVNIVKLIKNDYPNFQEVDCVVGVPMHSTKERERMFNQSYYLCEVIAKGLNIPNLSKSIKQTVSTPKQSQLKRSERLSKPYDIYKKIGTESFKDKKVLLVDDVFTTGTTVNGLSKFLISHGVQRVYVVAIATSSGDSSL